jgi:hypothetical protein
MKEAWKNTSQAERSREKCEREQQKQKEQNELHETMVRKEVQQSMQDMFKQPHQHHHLTMIPIWMNLTN